jgi:hypothetical protein
LGAPNGGQLDGGAALAVPRPRGVEVALGAGKHPRRRQARDTEVEGHEGGVRSCRNRGEHDTKLLRELAAAASQFWTEYDPARPATAPTNEEVIAWLLGRKVAKRVAEVIAQILRADDLRPGPHNNPDE